MSDPDGPPTRISLRELFDLIAARIAETDPPYDVEAGLAQLQAWIEAGEPGGPGHRHHPFPPTGSRGPRMNGNGTDPPADATDRFRAALKRMHTDPQEAARIDAIIADVPPALPDVVYDRDGQAVTVVVDGRPVCRVDADGGVRYPAVDGTWVPLPNT